MIRNFYSCFLLELQLDENTITRRQSAIEPVNVLGKVLQFHKALQSCQRWINTLHAFQTHMRYLLHHL